MEWTPDNTKSLRTWRGNYEINQRFLNRAADEIERLMGERQGIVNEREKFRTWSSVLCDAHVGRPIRKCPWCWLDETERRAEKAEAAISERDAEIGRLKHNFAQAEALIENLRIQRDRLQEGNMRLCVIINDNTPDGAQPCTVDMLEPGVKWLCGELHRLLALARELKAAVAAERDAEIVRLKLYENPFRRKARADDE